MIRLLSFQRFRPATQVACAALLLSVSAAGRPAPIGAPPGPLLVLAVDPAPHSVGAPLAGAITLRFDRPVDPASVTPSSVHVYGRWSGVVPGSLTVLGAGARIRFTPGRAFAPGEQISVRLSSQITAADGGALSSGYAFDFWAGTASGSGVLVLAGVVSTRLPGEGLVQSYGIYAGDLDGDGAPDFSVPDETANDVRVLANDGCGRFGEPVPHAMPFPSRPSANEGQDFDGDGVIDLAVANIDGDSMSVLRGDGAGGYLPPVSVAAGNTPRGLVVLDAEGDGDVDIAVANRDSSNLCLFRNDGSGAFAPAEVFEGGGAGETSLAASDADGDGDMDLFSGNHESDDGSLLLNDGTGVFSLSAVAPVGDGPWMVVAGDVHGDGLVDFLTVAAWDATVSVLAGDGQGGLTADATMPTGTWPIAVDLGDLDGDGDLDLVTSAIVGGLWRVWHNDGQGGWGPPSDLPSGTASSCATLVDYDRDGLLDVVGIDEVADEISFWHHVSVHPLGVQPAACEATLRVDNLAQSAGYGHQPARVLNSGDTLLLSITGPPSQSWGLLVGPPKSPGTLFPSGLLNLADPNLLAFTGRLDDAGEALLSVPIGPGLPADLELGLQAVVGEPGHLRLSNPEAVHLGP